MAYYTDEDRKRAATKRKLNSQFRQLIKSPEDAFDILGVAVPRVTHRPTFDEYGLPDDVEERLKLADEQYVRGEKSKRKVIALIVTAALIGLFFYVMGLTNETTHPEYFEDGRLVNNAVAWSGAIVTFGGLFGLIGIWVWAFGVEPKETYEHKQFKQYKEQLSYYEYWQRKNSKDHWNKMSGHAFEQAVANLFRNIGFTAEVSNRGGDGGVDIILQKAHRKIAVQCKRYKSAVGPHVIRDLWGTMNYLGFNEGCIVTTTGFTKGVTTFAHENHIFLIDLNDILRATGEDGEAYLRKQIGN
jgi:hypothetical protein